MPSKRPAPLSDAALFSGKQAAAAAPAALPAAAPGGPLGETNDGVPLPVKNTFIDVPSGLTPSHMQSASARNQMLNTAPAELNIAPGFIKRSILASSAGQTVAAAEAATTVAQPIGSLSPVPASPQAVSVATPVSPTKRGLAGVVQRPALSEKSAVPGSSHGVPGSSHGYTPLMTPSPTGSSLFTVHRYQLFGGPAPVTEATHSALAPGGFGPYSAGLTGPLAQTRQLPGGPLTAAAAASAQTSVASASTVPVTASWPASLATQGATQMATLSSSMPIISAGTYSRPAHAAALQTEQMQQLKEREGEDDEDDSDEDEAQQQAQQQASGAAKTPEEAPKPPPGAEHPSLGSAEHAEGTCKRCCFFPRNRCLNGYNCDFCHYDHEKRKRKSKKKKKKDKAADGAIPGTYEALSAPAMGVGLPLSAPPPAAMQLTTLTAPTVAAPAHMAALPTHPAGSLMAAPTEPPPPLGMPTLAPSMDGFYEYGASAALAPQHYAPAPALASYQAGASSTSAALATVAAPSYFAPATGSTAQSAIESQRVVLPAAEPVHLLGTNPQAARYVVQPGAEVSQALYSTPPQQVQAYAPQQVTYPTAVEPHALSAGPPLYEATVPTASLLQATHASSAVSSTLPAHAPPAAPPALIASSVFKPPAAPPVLQPAGPWAPPMEAPNLQDVRFGEDMAPPPLEAPRAFPPTPNAMAPTAASLQAAAVAAQTQAAGGPKAPPPMSSPKLPKNMVLSLQQQGLPAPPGN